MCGRYTLHQSKRKLGKSLALEIPEAFEPDYNIAPGSDILTIVNRPEFGAQVELMQWGLKTPQNFHINARIETADTTPRFRESWAEHRCLVPANGYYEWYKDGISKQPYYLYPADEGLVYFAGIYFPSEEAQSPSTCVLLTTEAHLDIRHIHDRMPVSIPHAAHHEWLTSNLNKNQIIELGKTFIPAKHTISYRVNSAQNKESKLIKATAPETDDQMRLF